MADENDYNGRVIQEFRANGGKVGGVFEGRSLLLLHTLGARTGAPRVNPVEYLQLDNGYAVFATNDGQERNPGWYRNVLAHPRVTVEVGSSTIGVKAREAAGSERTEIWERQKEVRPPFAEYETQTAREIPVIVLETL
jgi:deazaflavin-dependent oxidoreductase (nitroreductase family)